MTQDENHAEILARQLHLLELKRVTAQTAANLALEQAMAEAERKALDEMTQVIAAQEHQMREVQEHSIRSLLKSGLDVFSISSELDVPLSLVRQVRDELD